MSFNEKLNKYLTEFKISSKQLSEISGISESVISRYRSGKRIPKTDSDNFNSIVDEDVRNCIQKVGIVRYSAFKDTGSDLSFALALLDEKNNGVILNGIYSREMSNIYAKPVENGKSTYTISKEEEEAIKKAMEKEANIRI